ncbi:hypothetical protein F5X96DRAFT_672598 [Biscogniauxia mediterranea]|nr:hypothetical protein F5X96DRAFT_672598 [Biscogniauxia mediterranea]
MASQDGQEPSSSSTGRNPLPRRPRGGARARVGATATAGAGAGAGAGASSSSTAAANPAAGASATAGAGAGVPAPGAGAGSNTSTTPSSGLTAAANPVAVGTGAGGGAGAGAAAPPAATHANHGQVVRVGADWKYECQCGARMANRAKNISSHMSKKHNPNGRYEQLYAPFGNNIPCAEPGCDATFRHRYDIIHHYRRRHNHRGSGNPLLERYGFE